MNAIYAKGISKSHVISVQEVVLLNAHIVKIKLLDGSNAQDVKGKKLINATPAIEVEK